MYRVTVDGVTKEWYSFEYALLDCLTRGHMKEWTIQAVTNIGDAS